VVDVEHALDRLHRLLPRLLALLVVRVPRLAVVAAVLARLPASVPGEEGPPAMSAPVCWPALPWSCEPGANVAMARSAPSPRTASLPGWSLSFSTS
jgi:hypothetical protein